MEQSDLLRYVVGRLESLDQYYREGGSEKHLRDIAGVLRISGDRIDREYIGRWAEQLGLQEIWAAVRTRIGE